ncbi:hypothetical protein AAFC00_003085 [Neodothiora populina]|uniref:Impact N-terminal domain-containing protein n=1 Tax=Neodothiora populina TaxID=2781224 RepID=A0ABR3P9H4_9PEZI
MKRQRSASSAASRKDDHDIWQSTKIEDRASIFIAYFSPTMPPKELQSTAQISAASHRMLAWRKPGSQRTLHTHSRALELGSDDDGEQYGGKRVLKVLEEMRVEGSLVVARWYGGVMLGPVRFNHIEDVARDAVRAWQQQEESEGAKRRKVTEEANEKVNLVLELRERDQSIKVLRGLLEDAQKAGEGEVVDAISKSSAPASILTRKIDYASMTLDRLRQMDKARDSTVAFLLKKIDETEKQHQQQQQQQQTLQIATEEGKSGDADQLQSSQSAKPTSTENKNEQSEGPAAVDTKPNPEIEERQSSQAVAETTKTVASIPENETAVNLQSEEVEPIAVAQAQKTPGAQQNPSDPD